ncbi:MAG: bifunctional riboflavin kinase/FAD synthetase [Acidobacteriota bacterium]
MQILQSPAELATDLPYPVATVGNFDGVHRGHARLLESICTSARRVADSTAVVITFCPHPQKVLHPESGLRLIATTEQKRRMIAAWGVDLLLELPFDQQRAALSPEEFVHQTLLRGIGVREVHVGRNFRFGNRRAGDFETLVRLGRQHGFTAKAVTGVRHSGRRVSSSRVRRALMDGDVVLARLLLGRDEELTGVVIKGAGRGRRLGFPTANLAVANELLPRSGVYATRLVVDGRPHPSVTNIGRRPTFGEEETTVETHILDFQGDLYGKRVAVQFVSRLRDEQRFPDRLALKQQIETDLASGATASCQATASVSDE